MNKQEALRIHQFLGTLQHLSIHTQKAYQRDLVVLLKFADAHDVQKWNELDGRQIRSFLGVYRQMLQGSQKLMDS